MKKQFILFLFIIGISIILKAFVFSVYHVISGSMKPTLLIGDKVLIKKIFLSDNDRCLFLDLVQELSERFNIEVYAYVLMGNHYHLLLKTPDANLSKGMQWFGTTYTRQFNLLNSQSGHLFQGRFKSIIVERECGTPLKGMGSSLRLTIIVN